MGILEEIQKMRQLGMQDGEIIVRLQEQGNPYRAISDAMSQSKIKQAVEGPEEPLPPIQEEMQAPQNAEQYSPEQEVQYPQEAMQPSIMPQAPQQQEAQQEYFSGYNPQAQAPQQDYPQQNYEYSQSQGLSSDTIMEISEQVVSEKLSDVRKKLEKMSSFKAELETKTEAIEDRLKRIETIIDTLQASVLRKVGDYVTNVEDIKKELVETQKTFAKVIGNKHHHQEHKK